MAYKPNDFYAQKAKSEDYAARSVYKLKEIDEKYNIFKAGLQVMDLGASPGSWSQFAAQKVGNKGKVFSIDLNPLKENIPNIVFKIADIRETDLIQLSSENGFVGLFDLVMSDMAPKTTGVRVTDQARSLQLCELAFQTACKCLKVNGHFICKLFDSEDTNDFCKELNLSFEKVNILRPKSTRKESKEIFIIARNFLKKEEIVSEINSLDF